tara:strand:+ start:207 stop:404 length:198 start_codon:yes stop_codon:yes gene_type:complete
MNKIILIISIYFIFTVSAHAYLDPGTGSIIISAIIAGLITVKTYWNNFFQKLKKKFEKKDKKKNN